MHALIIKKSFNIATLATDFPEMKSASWQFIWSWFIHRWYHDINPTEVRKIYVHAGPAVAAAECCQRANRRIKQKHGTG